MPTNSESNPPANDELMAKVQQWLKAYNPAPPYSFPQQQSHSTLQDPQRQAVQAALQRLPPETQVSMPNIEVVPKSQEPYQPKLRTITEGRVKPGDPNIYISESTPNYQKASGGDDVALMRLVSQLIHERHHVEKGPDEGSAYDAQLAILDWLKAPKKIKDDVLLSKSYVTGTK